MKKFTLAAAALAVALGAGATEFNVTDASVAGVLKAHANANDFYVILLDEAVQETLAQAHKVTYIGAEGTYDNEGNLLDGFRPLQVWENTFEFDEGRGQDPDGGSAMISLKPIGETWWGGGYNVDAQGALDLSGITKDFRFHLAYMTTGNAPEFTQINLLDHKDSQGNGSKASFAIGRNSDEGAEKFGDQATEDWQAVDFSMADLMKANPDFSFDGLKNMSGFTMSFNGGAANGTNIVLAAAYFYNPEGAGQGAIETIETAENATPVYYNLQGVRVANPENGMFIVKAGKEVKKVIL